MESEKGNFKASTLYETEGWCWDNRQKININTLSIIYYWSVQLALKRIFNNMSILYDWIIIHSIILINFSWFIQMFIVIKLLCYTCSNSLALNLFPHLKIILIFYILLVFLKLRYILKINELKKHKLIILWKRWY